MEITFRSDPDHVRCDESRNSGASSAKRAPIIHALARRRFDPAGGIHGDVGRKRRIGDVSAGANARHLGT